MSCNRKEKEEAGATAEQEKKWREPQQNKRKMAGAVAEQKNKDGGSHSRKEKGKKL